MGMNQNKSSWHYRSLLFKRMHKENFSFVFFSQSCPQIWWYFIFFGSQFVAALNIAFTSYSKWLIHTLWSHFLTLGTCARNAHFKFNWNQMAHAQRRCISKKNRKRIKKERKKKEKETRKEGKKERKKKKKERKSLEKTICFSSKSLNF